MSILYQNARNVKFVLFVKNSSVNTSFESCTTHLLRQEESQSQSEKNAQCELALKSS